MPCICIVCQRKHGQASAPGFSNFKACLHDKQQSAEAQSHRREQTRLLSRPKRLLSTLSLGKVCLCSGLWKSDTRDREQLSKALRMPLGDETPRMEKPVPFYTFAAGMDPAQTSLDFMTKMWTRSPGADQAHTSRQQGTSEAVHTC